MGHPFRLIVTDIDNTLFDWVNYYVNSLRFMLEKVSEELGIPLETLMREASHVFETYKSIEYPFLVQELPSVRQHFGKDLDGLLGGIVPRAREWFREEAVKHLSPYPTVKDTLVELRRKYGNRGIPLKIVALTDTPRYIAMWKLNKMGILDEFDAVYGLADPVLPFDEDTGRVMVEGGILEKHFRPTNFGFRGQIRTLPAEYAKPKRQGLKTVLMDFDMDEDPADREDILWIGDNIVKDVSLGRAVKVRTAWARYGTDIDESLYPYLRQLSPSGKLQTYKEQLGDGETEKHGNADPDYKLESFADVLSLMN